MFLFFWRAGIPENAYLQIQGKVIMQGYVIHVSRDFMVSMNRQCVFYDKANQTFQQINKSNQNPYLAMSVVQYYKLGTCVFDII